jgi:hypothetical protein
MAGSSDSVVNSSEVDPVRSGAGGWKRELGNGVEYERVLAGHGESRPPSALLAIAATISASGRGTLCNSVFHNRR